MMSRQPHEVSKPENNGINSLPMDILILIFSYLKISDLIILERVSKYFQYLAKDNRLWLRFLKEINPNLERKADIPHNIANKTLYKDYKNGTYLQGLFRKEHPEVRLVAPPGKIDHDGFIFRTPNELQSICAYGTEEEIKNSLSALAKETKLRYDTEGDKGLVNILNLCLNNPNSKNAFKILVESLDAWTRNNLLNNIRDKDYFYITLNVILHKTGPFEIQKNIALIISLLGMACNNTDYKNDYIRAIKFLIAFDLKCLQTTTRDRKETPFHIICKYYDKFKELFYYFATNVVFCNTEFILATDSNKKTPLHYFIQQLPILEQKNPGEIKKVLPYLINLIKACPPVLTKFDSDNNTILMDLLSDQFFIDHCPEDFWDAIDEELFKLTGETLLIRSLCEKIKAQSKSYFINKFLTKESKKDKKYINRLNHQGRSALHFACSYPNWTVSEEIVSKLLGLGASVGQLDNEGKSALVHCCQNVKISRLLLEAGADPNRDINLLYKACDQGHKELVELLIEYGANIHLTEEGNCALYFAVFFKHETIIELLLKNGANTNVLIQGKPILNIALEEKCNLKIIQALLRPEYKTDPTIKAEGVNGKSALELSKPYYEIHQTLKEAAKKLGYNLPTKADLIKENEELRRQLTKFLNQSQKVTTEINHEASSNIPNQKF